MLLVQSKFRKDYLRSWFINSSDHSWLLGGTTQCLELSLCSKTSQTTHVANQNDKNVFSVTSHCPKNTLIVCINNCLVPKRKMKGNVLETTITNISFKFYKNNDIWINYIRQRNQDTSKTKARSLTTLTLAKKQSHVRLRLLLVFSHALFFPQNTFCSDYINPNHVWII